LAELGGEIGSDVGFFIYGAASRCTGRGEKVAPLPEWKDWRPRIVLLKPSFGVSTPDAYRRWAGSRELPGIPYGEQDVDGHVLVNDLERPVFEKHLFLAEMKRWLVGRPGVRGAMMSGSGSTMFAVVEDEGAGRALMEDAARELDPTLWMWSGLVMQDDAR
ncbi:MAG: 4-(cytidine 5'-diphospho)-2-C-methyl-D-erythritol kinase, partial [Akkermansia sp.]|nr:4-(cytidine 5'-diphospho)-2-C-methyl-D-erythritol kinase [Akkermansia sp.]